MWKRVLVSHVLIQQYARIWASEYTEESMDPQTEYRRPLSGQSKSERRTKLYRSIL